MFPNLQALLQMHPSFQQFNPGRNFINAPRPPIDRAMPGLVAAPAMRTMPGLNPEQLAGIHARLGQMWNFQ